jgi:hypothetical protein
MSLSRRVALLAIASLALAAPAQAADNGPDDDDHVVITGGFALGPQQVAGDVVVIDGDVLLAGRVTGDVVVIEGDLRVLGSVAGDVTTISGRATLGPRSRVDGDLVYSDEEPELASGAVVGGEVREEDWSEIGDAPWAIIGAAALWIAVSVSLLVLGVALVAILPRAADAAYAAADSQIWLVVAMGVAGVIGLPIVIGLAAVTLVGIPLAIVVALAVVPLWALGYVICCYVLGRQIVGDGPHHILAFLAGLGVLRAVALVPVVGAIAWIPAVIVGLGALIVAAMPNGSTAPAKAS